MLDKNKKACYNVLSKQKENRKCLQIKSAKTSRKLKREVNRRRKLKAGLKLNQKGGEMMKIEITTCNAITCEELKDFMMFLSFAEKRYPSLEVSLKAEVLEKSVKPKKIVKAKEV